MRPLQPSSFPEHHFHTRTPVPPPLHLGLHPHSQFGREVFSYSVLLIIFYLLDLRDHHFPSRSLPLPITCEALPHQFLPQTPRLPHLHPHQPRTPRPPRPPPPREPSQTPSGLSCISLGDRKCRS
jgi:hypothetical protein